MKRYTLLLLCWIFFPTYGWQVQAQSRYQEAIDSLLLLLGTVPEDTNKIKIYGDLSYNYAGTRTELDVARAYADSMRFLSQTLKYKPGIIQAYMYYGVCDRYQGNSEQALAHFQTFVDYYKKHEDELMEARGWFLIATVHEELGNFDQSMAACEKALDLYEKNSDWNGVVATLNSIGIIYKRTEKFEKAVACYKKAVAVNDTFNLKRDLTNIYMNTGNAYAELKEFTKALNYYQQSLDLCYASDNKYGIALNLSNIGYVYNLMKQYSQALELHLQALQIWKKLPNKTKLALSLIETGDTFLKLQQFPQAKKHLDDGEALAKKVQAKHILLDAYKYQTELYVALNDYRKAYEFEKMHHTIQDSIFSEDNIKQINELQTKYETAEKDKQITLLAKEKVIQQKEVQRQAALKQAFLLGFGLVSLLAILLVYLFQQRLKNQKLLATKNEEIRQVSYKQQLIELEMKALRAQMNPHFIFNCINSINRMVLSGEAPSASRYLTRFAKLIRMMLENSENPTVSLDDELSMLQAYLQLEGLRFKEKLHYEIIVDDCIDRDMTHLPSMVLQPFIENAIWHGLMPKHGQGVIKIAIQEEEGILKCVIEDNGVGREQALSLTQSKVLKKRSLGLQITEERLKLLNKVQLRDLIRITDLKDSMNRALGTRVDVLIPITYR